MKWFYEQKLHTLEQEMIFSDSARLKENAFYTLYCISAKHLLCQHSHMLEIRKKLTHKFVTEEWTKSHKQNVFRVQGTDDEKILGF